MEETKMNSINEQLARLRTLMASLTKQETNKIAEADKICGQLNLELATMTNLFGTTSDKEQWLVIREVLELTACLSAARESISDFAVQFKMLEGVYFHPTVLKELSPSPRQALLIGLALTMFLVDDDLASFHILLLKVKRTPLENYNVELKDKTTEKTTDKTTEDGSGDVLMRTCSSSASDVEYLRDFYSFFGRSFKDLTEQEISYLSFPMDLERYLSQGNIPRVVARARGGMPDPLFSYLGQQLVASLRVRTAACAESAYKHLAVSEVCRLLAIETETEFLDFVAEHNERNKMACTRLDQTNISFCFQQEMATRQKEKNAKPNLLKVLAKSDPKTITSTSMNVFSQTVKPLVPVQWIVNTSTNMVDFVEMREPVSCVKVPEVVSNLLNYAKVWESISY